MISAGYRCLASVKSQNSNIHRESSSYKTIFQNYYLPDYVNITATNTCTLSCITFLVCITFFCYQCK